MHLKHKHNPLVAPHYKCVRPYTRLLICVHSAQNLGHARTLAIMLVQPVTDEQFHFCAPVVHFVTGETITSYKRLASDPATRDIWRTGFGKEWGRMAQGDNKTKEKGTNSIFVMSHKQIEKVTKEGRIFTYARIVVDFRPQKKDPNRVRLTAGGNLIKYPGELTTRTADLTTSKCVWNSVLSTKDARFMGIDIKNFYLGTPLERFEYMKLDIRIFPQHVIDQYSLLEHVKDGFVHVEICRAIYGLPRAGILANQQLRERLAPFGCYEVAHTPGLWRHVTKPVQFSLVVDDFGVKYVGEEHVRHLIQALKTDHKNLVTHTKLKLTGRATYFVG